MRPLQPWILDTNADKLCCCAPCRSVLVVAGGEWPGFASGRLCCWRCAWCPSKPVQGCTWRHNWPCAFPAGLLRSQEGQDEQDVLYRALRDLNRSKILAQVR